MDKSIIYSRNIAGTHFTCKIIVTDIRLKRTWQANTHDCDSRGKTLVNLFLLARLLSIAMKKKNKQQNKTPPFFLKTNGINKLNQLFQASYCFPGRPWNACKTPLSTLSVSGNDACLLFNVSSGDKEQTNKLRLSLSISNVRACDLGVSLGTLVPRQEEQ